jgi:hypothetical protein
MTDSKKSGAFGALALLSTSAGSLTMDADALDLQAWAGNLLPRFLDTVCLCSV